MIAERKTTRPEVGPAQEAMLRARLAPVGSEAAPLEPGGSPAVDTELDATLRRRLTK